MVNDLRDFEQSVLPAKQTFGEASTWKKDEYLLLQCLIVSCDVERQEMLARGAADSGWETIVCSNAESAWTYQRFKFVQLAVVDLASDLLGELRELLKQFSSLSGLLTIVCGNEADMEEEIWVRQLGAWLYLPGVTEATDVSLLCGEAKHIVERLHVAAIAPAERKAALRRSR